MLKAGRAATSIAVNSVAIAGWGRREIHEDLSWTPFAKYHTLTRGPMNTTGTYIRWQGQKLTCPDHYRLFSRGGALRQMSRWLHDAPILSRWLLPRGSNLNCSRNITQGPLRTTGCSTDNVEVHCEYLIVCVRANRVRPCTGIRTVDVIYG